VEEVKYFIFIDFIQSIYHFCFESKYL